MKIRGLIVAALAFFILAGILYWSEHHKPADDAKASADAPPAILKLDASAITRLDLAKRDAQPVVLTKSDAGKWQITGPQPFGADQAVVSGILSAVASLNSERLVEDKAANLKPYGLDPPAFQLDITGKDNKMQKLLIGDDTPTGGATYAMLAGDPRVFTMATYAKTGVDKGLDDLRDKRLLTVDQDKISGMELIRKNQDIEFGRNKDEWRILKPQPWRADPLPVSELARKLTDARMDLAADPKDAASAFARATPFATVKVADESGSQELQVRKAQASKIPANKPPANKTQSGQTPDTYYAKSSAVGGIYKINADLGQALDKNLDDFRTKKLFDFGFSDPNKIELHAGPKTYVLTRNGEDWWQDGKKVDAATTQSLVSKLRDLAADKFSESGFANPAMNVTVTSDEGKRVEKIEMAKSGDGYLAKRENEPALYHLASGFVDDLQKAAEEIQPAALVSKSK